MEPNNRHRANSLCLRARGEASVTRGEAAQYLRQIADDVSLEADRLFLASPDAPEGHELAQVARDIRALATRLFKEKDSAA